MRGNVGEVLDQKDQRGVKAQLLEVRGPCLLSSSLPVLLSLTSWPPVLLA